MSITPRPITITADNVTRIYGNALVRKGYALLGRSELENYYREHYRAVAAALEKWDRDRTDLLFHGAAAVIVVGSLPGASVQPWDFCDK